MRSRVFFASIRCLCRFFFFSSRRRHTRSLCDWSSDVCSSDLTLVQAADQPGSLRWKIKHDQRINILLLGYGGPGHDGAYLTDSIVLVSIQPGSKEAVMTNLPRDLWVKIPALPNNGYMQGKLNSAYQIGQDRRNYPNVRATWKTSTGGGDLAAATIEQITGQHVDYWVGVDFSAFRDVV